MSERAAAIDVGTNTLLLLVAERSDAGELTAVREEIRFGRLGQGVDEAGELRDDAITRSLEALRAYRAIIDELGCSQVGAVGTQALREAVNPDSFLAPAADILGVPIDVVSGEREAELEYRAAAREFPGQANDGLIVVDVGGGSTEVIVGEAHTVRARRSLPIGSVRMAERHLGQDPPAKTEIAAMIGDIDAALADLHVPRASLVVGMSGTATTLAALDLELETFDAKHIEGHRLGRATIDGQLDRLLELTIADRKQLPGLEPQRADVIPAGAAVLARILRRVEASELIVSARGVRWGLVDELLGD